MFPALLQILYKVGMLKGSTIVDWYDRQKLRDNEDSLTDFGKRMIVKCERIADGLREMASSDDEEEDGSSGTSSSSDE